MKHSYCLKETDKNHEGFTCQRQSFSERNIQEALLFEKEILR